MADFRVDPGVAVQMIESLERESNPFTLFNVALDQNIATDIRRIAANRLNVFSKEAIEYIRCEKDIVLLSRIARSNLFPSTFLCVARAKVKSQSNITYKLIELLEEQNRLLRLKNISAFEERL